MEHFDNIIGVLVIGIIAGLGIWLLPDGSGKEIAIAAVSGITGYMTKGVLSDSQDKKSNPIDVKD